MSEATIYKCPQCFAPLKLDPASGQLTCEFCGGSFDPAVIEAQIDEKNVQREKAKAKVEERERENRKKGGKNLDTVPEGLETASIEQWEQIIAANAYEQFDEMVGYTCTSCGAQVVAGKLTVATSCQYCGSSVVVDERLTGGLKPSYVIPFKLKAKDIPDRLTAFYKNRPLLPKNFFYNNQVGQVQGLYVPFWLYDGVIHGDAKYGSIVSREYREGAYDVTKTKYYNCTRVGDVAFNDVPVDASERIDDDLMDSIEPFRYRDMKPFKAAYLTGFVAERFDQSPRQVIDRAMARMWLTAEEEFSASVAGAATAAEGSKFEFTRVAASYAMLPVYLFNCQYSGKNYRYAVNGQTGKIVGEVPIGRRESAMAFLKPFLLFGSVTTLVLGALGIIMRF